MPSRLHRADAEPQAAETDRLDDLRWWDPALPPEIRVFVTHRLRVPASVRALGGDDVSGARGLLRAAAASAYGVAPDAVFTHAPRHRRRHFVCAPRPGFVRVPGCSQRLWTSLSRAGDLFAVALAPRRIGIDIETLQTDDQARDLLTVLHPADRRHLAALTGEQLRMEATGAWTRVEAELKRLGTGLHRDPATVRVVSVPDSSARRWGHRGVGASTVLTRALVGHDSAVGTTHMLSISWG